MVDLSTWHVANIRTWHIAVSTAKKRALRMTELKTLNKAVSEAVKINVDPCKFPRLRFICQYATNETI